MDMMETKNGGLIPHFIPSILFILSVALNVVTGQLRWALIICQEVRPGRRPSQKVQPLTGLPVIDMAPPKANRIAGHLGPVPHFPPVADRYCLSPSNHQKGLGLAFSAIGLGFHGTV